ncbi:MULTISPECIES: amino acid ABC transporter permease [unclassified Planomicrobium]|uniref:amino acid ABC transporter permease n=1 Tax=unclassified Planomicrobium TaxID=2625360 RepID=UPI0011B3D631|nr:MULTISPECIES: amino acid ABC transporter permease [unclassified Planomicrobium]TWT16001.1 amino acid ABC transporter permease [Planomicrobium sp. CPCC 101079]TWT27396.1 amino acid ABC transporter permease [Planomicrobium sp. CPCC 101110]
MPEIFVTVYDVFMRTYPGFLEATLVTLQLTAVGVILGTVIGLIFALMKISGSKILRGIANTYITIIRGTPLIVQIMFLYFGIVEIYTMDNFWAGSIALGIHNGAYIAEIFRGAIQGVDPGQREASMSLGMNRRQTMSRIVFPQALRRSIPPLGNQFIITLKDSSLVYVIGVSEIFSLGNREAAQSYQPFESFLVVALYYLVLVMIFTFLLRLYENKLDVDRA